MATNRKLNWIRGPSSKNRIGKKRNLEDFSPWDLATISTEEL